MSEELKVAGDGGTALAELPNFMANAQVDQGAFEEMTRASFMPRVQLCSGSSDIVKEGKMGVGKYALIRNKEDFVDFGPEVTLLPLAWRFAAMRFGVDGKAKVYYDKTSDEFKAVQADSGEKDARCAYGPQFLVWVPQTREFATFFFGSGSARPEAKKMAAQLNKATMMKARLVSNQQNKWHVPVCIASSTQIAGPSVDAANVVVEAFLNPPATEGEVVEGAPDSAAPAATGRG